MRSAIVLLSGGLDSTVTAAIAVRAARCVFVHVNYGQRTEARELKSFKAIVRHYNAESLIIDASHYKAIGHSALTDTRIDIPKGDVFRKGIPATYVPFRNAHMLSIAVAIAEAQGAEDVYVGAVEEDGSGYPDCREEFFRAFEKMAALGTKTRKKIRIKTPLIHKNKEEIVRLGVRLGAPLHLTWSCYKNEDKACGRCDSCLLRLKGFNGAGVKDPIKYKLLFQKRKK